MDQKYYFLHIPKTAGTSLINWIHNSGRFKVCPEGLWSRLLTLPKNDLQQYTMFCGHFYRYLTAYLNQPLLTFTFLRNPFDRAVSHYEHIRRDQYHYFHERVKEQGSLLVFLKDPITQPLIKNFQVRSFSAFFDPIEVKHNHSQAINKKYPIEEYLETADYGLDDSTALLIAKDYLTRCIFVGITEKMQESADALAMKIGISKGLYVEHLNSNPAGSKVNLLTREEWAALARLVEADWELYEFGLKIFEGYRR